MVLAKVPFYDLDGDALEYELRYDGDASRIRGAFSVDGDGRIVTTGNTRRLLGLNFGASNTSNYVTLCVEASDRNDQNDPEVVKVTRCFDMDFTNKNWPEQR